MKLSIIIPAYNAGNTIEECVRSALQQEMDDFEVICIDDGSTDGTAEVLDAIEDSRLQVFHVENGGVSCARNFGLKQAQGEYVCFVDSDDYLEPDSLYREFDSQGNSDLVICGYRQLYEDGTMRDRNIHLPEEAEQMSLSKKDLEPLFPEMYRNMFFNVVWNKLFRRDLIRTGFPEDLCLGEDCMFVFDYMKQVQTVTLVRNAGYRFRVAQKGSLRKTFREKDFTDSARIYHTIAPIITQTWESKVVRAAAEYVYTENLKSILRRLIHSDKTAREQRTLIREWMKVKPFEEVELRDDKTINRLIINCFKNNQPNRLYLILFVTERLKAMK